MSFWWGPQSVHPIVKADKIRFYSCKMAYKLARKLTVVGVMASTTLLPMVDRMSATVSLAAS